VRHEIQWLKNDMGDSIIVGRFELRIPAPAFEAAGLPVEGLEIDDRMVRIAQPITPRRALHRPIYLIY
jgi:hypothetical protein